MQKVILSAAAMLALAGATYLMLPRPSQGRATELEVEQLQSELRELRDELRVQKSWTTTRLRAAEANESSAQLAPERGAALPSEQAPAQAPTDQPRQRSEEEMAQRLHDNFDSQTLDRAWSAGATPTVQKLMTNHLPQGSRLRAVECRETTCRVETTHPDLETYRTFMHDAFTTPGAGGWDGPTMITLASPSDASTLEAVAYLARPGTDLVALANGE